MIKDTFIYTLGNIIPKIGQFILLPIYTSFLSPEEYGVVSSMLVFHSVIIIFFSLSLEHSIVRLYFDFDEEESRRDYFGTMSLTILFFSTICMLILFVSNNFVGKIYESIEFHPLFTYVIFYSFFDEGFD